MQLFCRMYTRQEPLLILLEGTCMTAAKAMGLMLYFTADLRIESSLAAADMPGHSEKVSVMPISKVSC